MVEDKFESELVKLGARIKAIRKHRGLTQLGLATLTGSSDNMISRYERGLENIGFQLVYRIAKELKVSITELTNYNGPLPDNGKWKNPLPKTNKKKR